jgi:hypothetical protein
MTREQKRAFVINSLVQNLNARQIKKDTSFSDTIEYEYLLGNEPDRSSWLNYDEDRRRPQRIYDGTTFDD